MLLPLLTLVVMWVLATAVTLGPGLELLDAQVMVDNVGRPGNTLLVQVQRERKLTVAYLGGGRKDPAALAAQRGETDMAVTEFRRMAGADDVQDAASLDVQRRLAEFEADLDSIAAVRADVDRADIDRPGAMRRYTQVIDSSFAVFESLIGAADADLARQSHAILQVSRAIEVLAQEDAILTGAIAAGTISGPDLGQVIQLIGAQRFLFASTLTGLYVSDRQDYLSLAQTEEFVRLTQMEDAIIADGRAGAALPIDREAWPSVYHGVSEQLRAFELRVADGIVERGGPTALLLFGRIAVAGLLGLLVVVVTVVASIRMARTFIKRLAGLRQAALELAIDRLPRVVGRLRRGEPVDVANEAPPLPYGDDEIGQVGHAFNELQRTAVNSAVDEANVRQGLNEVFLNIARRSQTLLHRQLSILDNMERRTDDPVELEDLFRVDHLATRMRRHAEDLVILAGAAPGRGWRNPVALVDVLRGAVSEVEDYARVSVRPMPQVGLTGRAVGDVIHLLAELIENATSFSPPHTRVSVGAEYVAHGLAIEIEDRGLGMTPDALAAVNHRLAHPPDFDLTNSAQLGLFVVARLAARHGVKVALRSSAYGGITAVALVPDDLIVTGEFSSRATPRARQAVAALPAAPHVVGGVQTSGSNGAAPRPGETGGTVSGGTVSGGTVSGGTVSGGTAYRDTAYRDTGFRDLPTGQRPAISAAPAPGPTAPGPTAPVPAAPGPTASAVASMGQPVPGEPMLGQVLPAQPKTAESMTAAPVPVAKPRPRHARSDVIEPPASAGPDGLPRRIRQTSLAPQLREGPPEDAVSGDIPTQGPGSRTPEELRAMMTSFQAGMARGRRDADASDDPDAAPPPRRSPPDRSPRDRSPRDGTPDRSAPARDRTTKRGTSRRGTPGRDSQ